MRLSSLLSPDIKQILKEDPDQIRELLSEIHAEDLADIVSELEPDEAAALLSRLPADAAAPIFERLEDHEQEELIREMPPESVAHIASEMESDDRADLFNSLPADMGAHLLATLQRVDPEAAAEVREIEKWPDTSAGHLMTKRYVQISEGMTAAEALDAVRAHARDSEEFVYNAYVLSDKRLMGIASIRDLITAAPNRRIYDLMRSNIISVPPTMDQEEVARRMAKYDLNAMPVVDEKGALLGIITIDDIIDVLVAEQTEDVQRIGGIEPLDVPYFQTSFWSFIRKRGVWLVVLFGEEFFTQTAMRHYDVVLEAIKGATYYIPLMLSTGGNSGSQSSTLVIRGLAVGEIKVKDWWRILVREAGQGVVLGLMLGTIGFARVLMYKDQHADFALTVGLTLVGIATTGCTVGAMLPLIMKRLGLDPATSSTPFIASFVDVLGIIVFVQIMKVIMSGAVDAAMIHAASVAAAGAAAGVVTP